VKKIYIAATQQHDGKTTISLGLYIAAAKRGFRAAFIKPVGQRYLTADGVQVDEDAVLFKRALCADGTMKSLNPVTIPQGFTEEYIFNRRPEVIRQSILDAFADVAADNDLIIIEGTGHAGVGSVIDASNAAVARLLEARCVIVSEGGIGRCIDEISLNRALFEMHGVPCLGAVINKVREEKYEKIDRAVRQGLKNTGTECLGVIPYRVELTYPTVEQLREELGLRLFAGDQYLANKVRCIIVGAMEPQNMIRYLHSGCLVVLPGDRVDNIVTSVNAHLLRGRGSAVHIAGLLLTGGLVPHRSIANILRQVDVPVVLTNEDTATAAYKARELVAKITPRDADKISLAANLIEEHVDVDKILEGVEPP
jgi:BioD-like phosphotransacetylase family protein